MNRWSLALGLAVCLVGAAVANAGITTFDSGTEGWNCSGRTTLSETGGNPGWNMDIDIDSAFGADMRNTENPEFLGDLTQMGALRFTIDVKVDSIFMGWHEVNRYLVVELLDIDESSPEYSVAGVWATMGYLTSSEPGWHTYSIDLYDPCSDTLPEGWSGDGASDPETGGPALPEGRTFASVLANVDELHFTTMVPGYFYGFADYDLQYDNVGFVAIPEPSTLGLLGLGAVALIRRRR